MASWFTPQVLFCVLNIIVGTIFITSKFKSQSKHHHRDGGEQNPNPIRIARAPSLLERVKSFDFSIFPPHQQENHHHDPPQLARAPSLLERVKSFDFSIFRPLQQENHHHDPPQLAPAPSLLERVKSIKFSLHISDHPEPIPTETHLADPHEDHHVIRSKSAGAGKASMELVAPEEKMKRSASEKYAAAEVEEEVDQRLPATVGEGNKMASFGGEDEGVDAKADDFINRFRQQLKLQRLDSLLRYKEMLKRGSSK